MKIMKNKKLLLIVIAVVFIAVATTANRGKKMKIDDASAVFSIRTSVAECRDLHVYIETNGNIEPVRSVDVYPDMGGKLVQMSISLGSRVKRGQILGYIDPSIPGVTYAKSPIIAPISGSISSMPLETGTTVTVSTAVAVIGDIDNLQVATDIPERYVAELKPGLKAVVKLEAYPGEEFHATVTGVSPVVDEISRTKQLFLSFDTDDSRINAGMFAKIRLYTTVSENCLTVPETSITSNYDEHSIFVVNADNTVTKKSVIKGLTIDGITEIKSGLSDGDKIVIEGMQVLSDKAAVYDVDAPKSEKESETDSPKESFFKKLFGKIAKTDSKKENK